jgi:hypothetical protein
MSVAGELILRTESAANARHPVPSTLVVIREPERLIPPLIAIDGMLHRTRVLQLVNSLLNGYGFSTCRNPPSLLTSFHRRHLLINLLPPLCRIQPRYMSK